MLLYLFICFTISHLSSVEVGGWEEYILCQACLYDSFKDEFCFVLFKEQMNELISCTLLHCFLLPGICTNSLLLLLSFTSKPINVVLRFAICISHHVIYFHSQCYYLLIILRHIKNLQEYFQKTYELILKTNQVDKHLSKQSPGTKHDTVTQCSVKFGKNNT